MCAAAVSNASAHRRVVIVLVENGAVRETVAASQAESAGRSGTLRRFVRRAASADHRHGPAGTSATCCRSSVGPAMTILTGCLQADQIRPGSRIAGGRRRRRHWQRSAVPGVREDRHLPSEVETSLLVRCRFISGFSADARSIMPLTMASDCVEFEIGQARRAGVSVGAGDQVLIADEVRAILSLWPGAAEIPDRAIAQETGRTRHPSAMCSGPKARRPNFWL